MERTVWTDERIDDAMDRLEARMDRLQHQIVTLALTQSVATISIIVTIVLRT